LEAKEESSEIRVTELEEKLCLAQEQVKEAQEAMLNCTVFNESAEDDTYLHTQVLIHTILYKQWYL